MRLTHLLLLLVTLGCEHRMPPATPWVAAGEASPPLQLHEAPLPAMADLDVLWDGLDSMGAQRQVWTMLTDFLLRVDGATLAQSEPARRLVANAVVRLSHAPDFMEHFAAVRKAVDALLAVAPDAPETRFCRGYVRWILLADGQGGLKLGALEPRVVQDLAADLRFLAQRYPDWRGPGEFTAARLRLELSRVDALLASVAPHAATETAP